jgi:hypothetical protein
MTRGMRLRWTPLDRGTSRFTWLEFDIGSGGTWLGWVECVQQKPSAYVARVRGAKRRPYRSTNLRRAKAWLRRQVAEQLEQVARRERRLA